MRCGTRWSYRGRLFAGSCEGVAAVAVGPAVSVERPVAVGPAVSVELPVASADGLASVVAVFAGCLVGSAVGVFVGCLAGSAVADGEAAPAAAYEIAGSGQ